MNEIRFSNYLLAKANVDAPTLGTAIAALNTAHTFAPLNPLHDTDVAGYLRHAHEQSLISSIEEGRRETGAEFYRLLDDRVRKDWEARKKKIFEELGVSTRVGSDLTTDAEGIARFSGEHAALKSQRAFGSSVRYYPSFADVELTKLIASSPTRPLTCYAC
jgi:nuclear pore complex protein Nup93